MNKNQQAWNFCLLLKNTIAKTTSLTNAHTGTGKLNQIMFLFELPVLGNLEPFLDTQPVQK